ncbi:MAG TPA: DUF6600 domain-containing protein [Chthoniobacteraceae bacterium]|jgi:hypothetical protein|nr:DUF6600 domain-containing protein [Chthoniobacteraceae bacterium]
MKIPKPSILLLAMLALFGALSMPHARAQVSVNYFYDTLSPYGEWVDDPDYGYCWHPTNVADNWAPYTDGYWAYTDSGWTWVSYEDYGGVVYHYGRWANLQDEGWVWVPGYTWAPAWVSWRYGGGYCGWAPLPPEARWSASVGFGEGVDAHFDIGPGFFNFVRVDNFGAPALGPVIVNREQNVTIINNTTNITNITTNNSNVYVGGPSYATLSAHSSRPIPTLKLVRESDASLARGGKVLSHQQGNQLMVVAPHVAAPAGRHAPAPARVAKTISDAKAEHGWASVKDPAEREKLRSQFKEQGTRLSAKPVNQEEIKAANERIKNEPKHETTAEQTAAPEEKTKKLSNEELLNAPAKEEANTEETPKSKKSKHEEATEEGATGEPTPSKHSRKARTPSDEQSYGEETPKHSKKKESEGGLQPFMGNDEKSSKGGDESAETPKSKKEYSNDEKNSEKDSKKDSEYSDESKGAKEPKTSDREYRQGDAGSAPGNGEKGGSNKKKKSKEDQGNPNGPGQ